MTTEEKRKRATLRQREWRAKNPQKARDSVKRHRDKNRDRHLAKNRAWREANPEVARAASRRWAANNPDRRREHNRRWRADNLVEINADRRVRYRQTAHIRREAFRIKRDTLKRKLVIMLGGKCVDCGYNKHLAALDFHHKADDKEAQVSHLICGSWDRVVKEAMKCELVCSNCHRVRHHGTAALLAG